MDDYSPESLPFTSAMNNAVLQLETRRAMNETCEAVDMAKRMLLQHRVRQFTAADVVALTRLILEREQVLASRGND